MFHNDDPYGQSSLPYESYAEPFQQQAFEKLSVAPQTHTSFEAPARASQAKSTATRMSKAEALAFVSKCKRWLIASSIIAFGVLSGLVAVQLGGTASAQPSNSTAVPGSNSSTDTSSSDGGFFQQQPQQQGGYGFGNGGFGQSPFSGSHTS